MAYEADAAHAVGERGKVLGINVAMVYLGLSIGPFPGGLLTEQLGWRSIFLINLPLGLTAIALMLGKVKGEWRGAAGQRFDYGGATLYGAG